MYFRQLERTWGQQWWGSLLRGLALVLFGLVALFFPPLAAAFLVTVLGVVLVFDGLIILAPVFQGRVTRRLWPMLIGRGGTEIVVGLVMLEFRQFSFNLLVTGFAILMIFRGVLEFITYLDLKETGYRRWWTLASALISVGIGLLAILEPPVDSELMFILLVGIWSVHEGVTSLHLAWATRTSPRAAVAAPEAPAAGAA
jgi:uncharacterized membrane protein HdeD (DUF308 family)